jgi:phosphoglycolate phosphatase
MTKHSEGISIGLDLDLTLVDTRQATAFAMGEVNRQLSTAIDIGEFVSRLGPDQKRAWTMG